jgi:hypothetical protein
MAVTLYEGVDDSPSESLDLGTLDILGDTCELPAIE